MDKREVTVLLHCLRVRTFFSMTFSFFSYTLTNAMHLIFNTYSTKFFTLFFFLKYCFSQWISYVFLHIFSYTHYLFFTLNILHTLF
jgi:hypothetical protein